MEYKKLGYSLVALSVLFTAGCMKEKKLPDEQLITIYNSNMQETRKIAPLETVYAKIVGLKPNTLHYITLKDPDGNIISKLQVKSDENGVIPTMPIWYDAGLTIKDGNISVDGLNKLDIKSFWIEVKSESGETNFKQDFWILLKKPKQDEMPRPVVTSVDYKGKMENTFLETGSKEANGSISPYTKVYVKADRLPYYTFNGNTKVKVDKVDIYVVPFNGKIFKDGLDLENVAITSIKDVPTIDKGSYKELNKTLVWNLNTNPKLINPGDSNNAYSIIIDTNQNGKLDIGKDFDGDGKYDAYIDGIDGQGKAGFIILNTEANENHFSIEDKDKNKLDAIPENQAHLAKNLYFSMKNIPTTSKKAKIYVVDVDKQSIDDGTELGEGEFTDVRNGGANEVNITSPDNNNTFMPYIEHVKFLNTYYENDEDSNFTYSNDIEKDKKLDIIVDVNDNGVFDKKIDYYLPNSVTIQAVEDKVVTVTDPNDKNESTIFNETNSKTNTKVYIYFKSTGDSDHKAHAYMFKASTDIEKGDTLYKEIWEKEVNTKDGNVEEFIDFNKDYTIKNPTDKNNKYKIIIDEDNDGKYSNGDYVLPITIADTEANELPEVEYINIASGGVMGHVWEHWVDTPYTSAYDYRDVFTVSADDTIPPEYRYWGWWMKKGVKLVWNPYIKNKPWWLWHKNNEYFINEKGEQKDTLLYIGETVDVYIIPAYDDKTKSGYKLKNSMDLNDSMDVRGYHSTLPVQFSCRNGAYLQTVWEAPLKVGKYYVIVDVNRNGKVDDGIDLIDAVRKDGVTIKDDPNVVGFRVIED